MRMRSGIRLLFLHFPWFLLSMLAAASSFAFAAPPSYSLNGLTISGGSFAFPSAIQGDVIGGSVNFAGRPTQGFVLTPGQGLHLFDVLPGTSESGVTGMNNKGAVVGLSY